MAPSLRVRRPGRGAAFGDLDNDGDAEILIVNQNEAPRCLENTGAPQHRWIGFRTVGRRSNRDGVGARVEIHAGGRQASQEVQSGASYLSRSDPRLLFGLGDRASVDSVAVTWPSGQRDVHRGLPVDRYHRLVEGKAK
jgi:hypothetical protein